MTLLLPSEIRDAMVAHAREGRPREVCGVLGGRFDADESRVVSREPTANAAERPRSRYRLDPEEALATVERMEGRDEAVVGFYHSHPRGPPSPSEVDVASATWPDRSYVIVSLESADDADSPGPAVEIGSWRWRGDGFEREPVRPIPPDDDR